MCITVYNVQTMCDCICTNRSQLYNNKIHNTLCTYMQITYLHACKFHTYAHMHKACINKYVLKTCVYMLRSQIK